MRVRSRGTGLPVAGVMVPANQLGAGEPHSRRRRASPYAGEPTRRGGTARRADAALGPQRPAARPGGPRAGGSEVGVPPVAARHPGAAVSSHHAGAPGATSTFAPTSQVPPPVLRLVPGSGHGCAGVGVAFTHAPQRWRARWRWRGGPTTRNRGRRSSSVQPRRGSRGVRPAQLRCGGLPPKYVDGLGRAARSADEPGCRRLAGAGSGDGYAMDGGHRHTDRRCRTAGGSARSRAAGVAADWRVAALACWSAWRSG
jgi:hypothetical protein